MLDQISQQEEIGPVSEFEAHFSEAVGCACTIPVVSFDDGLMRSMALNALHASASMRISFSILDCIAALSCHVIDAVVIFKDVMRCTRERSCH